MYAMAKQMASSEKKNTTPNQRIILKITGYVVPYVLARLTRTACKTITRDYNRHTVIGNLVAYLRDGDVLGGLASVAQKVFRRGYTGHQQVSVEALLGGGRQAGNCIGQEIGRFRVGDRTIGMGLSEGCHRHADDNQAGNSVRLFQLLGECLDDGHFIEKVLVLHIDTWLQGRGDFLCDRFDFTENIRDLRHL